MDMNGAFIGTPLRQIVREMAFADEPEAIGGYRVSFERLHGRLVSGDYFPARNETPFSTEREAWTWAAIFAAHAAKEIIDIYVIYADGFGPVPGYKERAFRYHTLGKPEKED